MKQDGNKDKDNNKEISRYKDVKEEKEDNLNEDGESSKLINFIGEMEGMPSNVKKITTQHIMASGMMGFGLNPLSDKITPEHRGNCRTYNYLLSC